METNLSAKRVEGDAYRTALWKHQPFVCRSVISHWWCVWHVKLLLSVYMYVKFCVTVLYWRVKLFTEIQTNINAAERVRYQAAACVRF